MHFGRRHQMSVYRFGFGCQTERSVMRFPVPLWTRAIALMTVTVLSASIARSQPVCGSVVSDEPNGLQFGWAHTMTTWDPDGSGPLPEKLVMGGSFNLGATPGLPATPSVALWDGLAWQPILLGNLVLALTTFNGELVAGGRLSRDEIGAVEGVAAYDGTAWRQLGDDLVGNVESLIVYNNQLVAVGRVRRAGESNYEAAVVLVGGVWRSLGAPFRLSSSFGGAKAAAIFQDELYIGGGNLRNADSPMQYLAKWNGTEWRAVGGGVNSDVYAMTVHDNQLVIGGAFSVVDIGGQTIPANSVAVWDGQRWGSLNSSLLPLPGNAVPVVSALASHNRKLFVGGLIALDGSQGVVSYDGTTWETVGSGITGMGAISTFMPWRGGMLVGGWFSQASGNLNQCAAFFNGERWLPFSEASVIFDICSLSDSIYATGLFIDLLSWNTFTFAQRQGDRWAPVPGAPALTYASYINLIRYRGKLIVFGQLASAPGPRVVFVFDGTTWTQIGTFDDAVFAAAVWNDELYVAGRFQNIDNLSARRLAAWNGSTWRVVPGSPNSDIYALAANGPTLVAGGAFTRIGNRAASRLAQFDGTQWLPVGTGIPAGEVYAIEPFDNDLFIGGSFDRAGSVVANNIVRWDGTQFLNTGSGANGSVLSITTLGDRVFAGGTFTTIGGVSSSKVAIFEGVWRAIGGVSDNAGGGLVTQVRTIRNDVHFVGRFVSGPSGSANLWARWLDRGAPPDVTVASPVVAQNANTDVQLALTVESASPVTVAWRRNNMPVVNGPAGASPQGGTVAGAGSLHLSVSGVRLSDAGVYEATLVNACGTTVSPLITLVVTCDADFDNSAGLNSQDIFSFLTAWFTNDPRADFNASGSVTVQDVFSFLAAWFAGC